MSQVNLLHHQGTTRNEKGSARAAPFFVTVSAFGPFGLFLLGGFCRFLLGRFSHPLLRRLSGLLLTASCLLRRFGSLL